MTVNPVFGYGGADERDREWAIDSGSLTSFARHPGILGSSRNWEKRARRGF
jgi:hypothetical protein